jgi:hypothetical protein
VRRYAGLANALEDAIRFGGPDREGGHQDGGGKQQKLEAGHEGSFPRQLKQSIRLY